MKAIGFTGTQVGMSKKQKDILRLLLLEASEFHHGDCIGADAEADEIARGLNIPVVIHPPNNPSKRAFCAQPGDQVIRPLHYLDRNREIVEATHELIGAPRTDQEELRSGTWSTIRYARKKGKKVIILPR